jgi:hypothetical protein
MLRGTFGLKRQKLTSCWRKYIMRSFMLCVLNLMLFIDRFKDIERGWDVARLREAKNAYKI